MVIGSCEQDTNFEFIDLSILAMVFCWYNRRYNFLNFPWQEIPSFQFFQHNFYSFFQVLEHMLLLAGKIMSGVEKIQEKLLFREENLFLEWSKCSQCRKPSQQVRNFYSQNDFLLSLIFKQTNPKICWISSLEAKKWSNQKDKGTILC